MTTTVLLNIKIALVFSSYKPAKTFTTLMFKLCGSTHLQHYGVISTILYFTDGLQTSFKDAPCQVLYVNV